MYGELVQGQNVPLAGFGNCQYCKTSLIDIAITIIRGNELLSAHLLVKGVHGHDFLVLKQQGILFKCLHGHQQYHLKPNLGWIKVFWNKVRSIRRKSRFPSIGQMRECKKWANFNDMVIKMIKLRDSKVNFFIWAGVFPLCDFFGDHVPFIMFYWPRGWKFQ